MTAKASEDKPVIDDDHFTYESGMQQCISQYGENAKDDIAEAFEIQDLEGEVVDGNERTAYYIDELVRWCRNFNREKQEQAAALAELKAENEKLREACKVALHDFELINDTLVKMCKVHPFTLTPAQLREALAPSPPPGPSVT